MTFHLDTESNQRMGKRKWTIPQEGLWVRLPIHIPLARISHVAKAATKEFGKCARATRNGFYWIVMQSLSQFFTIYYKLTSKQFSNLHKIQLIWPTFYFPGRVLLTLLHSDLCFLKIDSTIFHIIHWQVLLQILGGMVKRLCVHTKSWSELQGYWTKEVFVHLIAPKGSLACSKIRTSYRCSCAFCVSWHSVTPQHFEHLLISWSNIPHFLEILPNDSNMSQFSH